MWGKFEVRFLNDKTHLLVFHLALLPLFYLTTAGILKLRHAMCYSLLHIDISVMFYHHRDQGVSQAVHLIADECL